MLMESKLIVDRDRGLREFDEVNHQPQNPVISIVEKVISYIFHPLFIPVYIALFVFIVRPHLFSTGPYFQKVMKLFRFIIMYTFFPLVTVLLAKGLGFLSSIYLKTQKDRI